MGKSKKQRQRATPGETAAVVEQRSRVLPSAPDRMWLAVAVLVLGGAVGLVYSRALRAPFIFDDVDSVEHNASITRLWPLVRDAEGPGPLSSLTYNPIAGRPLVNLSLAINFHFGQQDPFGYHVVNMVLHALSAMLLWAIGRRVLVLDYFVGKFQRVAEPLALFVALAWAVHPLQTEAVEYVTQRTELLMGWCYLTTVYCSLRYFGSTASRDRAVWLVLASLVCTAGMACKEVMVSAPVAVLLLDRTLIAGSFINAIRRSWPLYLGLSASWLLLFALNYGGPRAESAGFHLNVPVYAWWFTQAKILLIYLKLVVWPWPLVIFYEMPYLNTIGAAWPYLLAVGALAILTLYLLWRRTATGLLLSLVFLILSPTLVVPIITEVAAERRMYLPLAALVSLLVVGGYAVAERIAACFASRASRDSSGWWAIVCGLALIGMLCLLSARRLAAYADRVTIWQDAALHQPNNEIVLDNLGLELIELGRTQEAIAHYEDMLQRLPSSSKAHTNLGVALAGAGRFTEAIQSQQQALKLDPNFGKAQNNLGGTLLMLGQRDGFREGQLEEAIAHEREALRINPRHVDAHYNLGLAMLLADRPDEAFKSFAQAVKFGPGNPRAWQGVSAAVDALAARADAQDYIRSTLGDDSEFAEALDSLELLLVRQNRFDQAFRQFATELGLAQKLAWTRSALADGTARRAGALGAWGRRRT